MTFQRRRIQTVLGLARRGRINVGDFCDQFPNLCSQLRRDSESNVLSYWGQCSNVDDNTQTQIVDRKLLSVIGAIGKTSIRTNTGYHAGLMHTYGYLLSTLKTRFGYKHERWTSGVIERGLGLCEPVFHPLQCRGTLLQNVTLLVGGITLCQRPREFQQLKSSLAHVDSLLAETRFANLDTQVFCEQVRIAKVGTFVLTTHIAQLPKPSKSFQALVCYTTDDSTGQGPKFVTCFPVTQAGYREILSTNPVGAKVDVRLRFNARVEGFPNTLVKGRRSLGEK